MSNDFPKQPEQFREKRFAWQQAFDAHRFYLQELCHVHTVPREQMCMCVFEFLVSMLVKVWNIGGGKEREKSLFSALGLVVVVELFMRLCDTTLAAFGHRGNNKRVLNFGARAGNDCFITRLASWPLVGNAAEETAGLSNVSLNGTRLACVNTTAAFRPVANVAHAIVKHLMWCHQVERFLSRLHDRTCPLWLVAKTPWTELQMFNTDIFALKTFMCFSEANMPQCLGGLSCQTFHFLYWNSSVLFKYIFCHIHLILIVLWKVILLNKTQWIKESGLCSVTQEMAR